MGRRKAFMADPVTAITCDTGVPEVPVFRTKVRKVSQTMGRGPNPAENAGKLIL
jgi:hypothetical protein